MGELAEQIISGGPELLELNDKQQRVVKCLKENPSGWAWNLSREEIINPLRKVVKEDILSSNNRIDCSFMAYDMLIEACAREEASENWARRLIAWMSPKLPQFHFGPAGWHEAFRRAILDKAQWLRQHESKQKEIMNPSKHVYWDNQACLVLADLIEGE